jgi:NTP pyrophosphatase (non-canonical NTP hydrolase)
MSKVGEDFTNKLSPGNETITGKTARGESCDLPPLSSQPNLPSVEGGRFETWSLADFAGQCRMQSSDNLDPEYSAFMSALAKRLSGLAAAQTQMLTLATLQRIHIQRQEEWCPDQKPDLSFRGNELGGECGEAQNVIKKLERERHGWRGSRDTVEHLAEELADVIHCAVLVAITAGIDIQSAVVANFNNTSKKNGLSTLISTAWEDRQ